MGYLYKLVDIKSFNAAKTEGIINFNHPYIMFAKCEGKFIEFGHSIYERYKKDKLNIEPTVDDLKNITTWIDAFRSVVPNVSDCDIVTYSMQLYYHQVTRFCGYITRENLFDENILKEYLSSNSDLSKEKVAVIKIDEKLFNDSWFESSASKIYGTYLKINNKNNSKSDFKGISHIKEVTYTDDVKDYEKYLKLLWDHEENFDVSALFRFLSEEYKNEKETRITFKLNGFTEFSSCIAVGNNYSRPYTNLSEKLFNILINAFIDATSIENLERLYVKLNEGEIQFKEIIF